MSADDEIRERIDAVIASDRVVLFMKGTGFEVKNPNASDASA